MATAKLSFTKLVVLALAAAVLVEFSAAANHTVGDTTGWVNNPSGGATFYSNWASKQTFAIGDILVFNYVTGQHNVARVSKNAYDTCNPTSPMSIDTIGPTNIKLNATGEYYFFCTVGAHCTQGQKLAINVTSSATAPSPGAPSSPPTISPSPASPPPSTTAPPPSPTASPPSPTTSPPPSTTAPPPSPTASPPPSTTAPPPSSSTSPPPPSSPSPGSPTSPAPGTSTSPPPPPASSAPPKAVAAFAVVLMSIAIGVMC
ncbi:Blue copper protein [Camellia lanceoleosa]|uniref:Blue copper protein n=1 Tax=Camellia lanceoleosa TaxID=1840588 RepID=A0ACC0FJM4_9ERIC|nr:Blue copper protein [Camellia lanceoleosa]